MPEGTATVALITHEDLKEMDNADWVLNSESRVEEKCMNCGRSGFVHSEVLMATLRQGVTFQIVCTTCILEHAGKERLNASFNKSLLDAMVSDVSKMPEQEQEEFFSAAINFLRDQNVTIDDDVPEDHEALRRMMEIVLSRLSDPDRLPPEGAGRQQAETMLAVLTAANAAKRYKTCFQIWLRIVNRVREVHEKNMKEKEDG